MSESRPLIVVTNDDGFRARGIGELARVASQLGDVVVIAPAEPQSAKSSALTVNAALTVEPQPVDAPYKVFTVNGTPVDCVKVGMHAVLDRKPDLLLSGINHGSNAAVNNIYSGTMGAAMEGCILGIPSIGYSLLSHSPEADFTPILPMVEQLTRRVMAEGLPDGICLNVNFPAHCTPEGYKAVRAARGYWGEEYEDYSTPSDNPFYMLAGKFHNLEPDDPDTDEYWLERGWATVVPIRPDQTARDMIDTVKRLL